MVRGTYLPWPVTVMWSVDIIRCDRDSLGCRTGLGEEGAEAMVGLFLLALLGQVAIGLVKIDVSFQQH